MSGEPWRGFASDNYAGVHPFVFDELTAINVGHQSAYGDDVVTARAESMIRDLFGSQADFYPVFNGTGANVVALQSVTERWQSVIASSTAHIHADEGGAPEVMAGIKLWTVPTRDGKLRPEDVQSQCFDMDFVHRSQPGAVSITQSSEMGTVYTPEEVAALAEVAHGNGLALHMDGARLSNATASLGVPVRAFTTDAGVDLVSFGLTKNGAMSAESVVVVNPERVRGVDFLRKTSMQLSSKMRFMSAQFVALLAEDRWLESAAHANSMARRLESAVHGLPGVTITQSVQANAVFAVLPARATAALQDRFHFYTWNQQTGEVRWMCAWDTTPDDVDAFAAAIGEELASRA
ncbi:MAG: threonine aldolase family protein [Candidatus Nanopelagicales bacterium]